MSFSDDDIKLAATVGEVIRAEKHTLVTAESCTGGLVAALITAIDGSSQWFDRGFVTYSNQSKREMLGIPAQDLLEYGAVSKQIAGQMADRALVNSNANVAVSITGIAGPNGGSAEKPVGTVWFGWKFKDSNNVVVDIKQQLFSGSRDLIRIQAVRFALQGIVSKYSLPSQ